MIDRIIVGFLVKVVKSVISLLINIMINVFILFCYSCCLDRFNEVFDGWFYVVDYKLWSYFEYYDNSCE